MITTFAFIGAVLLIILGFIGIFVPFLPGVFLAWLGIATYASVTHFTQISGTVILVFLALSIASGIFDIVAPIIGARRFNASRYGIIGSSLGFLIGLMAFGPIGVILGPIAGAFVGELFAGKEVRGAARPAFGAFIGFLRELL